MRLIAAAAISSLMCLMSTGIAQSKRLNPMVDLLAAQKPVFGLYAPRAGRGAPPRPATDLAKEALAYEAGDVLFSGDMERNFDTGFNNFSPLVAELAKSPERLKHPLATKIPKIATDPAKATEYISRQLNLGVSTVVFVDVESADEAKQGLAAMRWKSKGGTRPEDVGAAPSYWGVSEQEYRAKADLWPLNPQGELVNWTIVESKEGLARVREIAAVKGIGVLFPGAGTLRGVFTTTDENGQRIFNAEGWENAIQQVLAACKEFKIACGYPATENDIEMRMKQGFGVFIINWGEAGFRAVAKGRSLAGR